jgi:DNA polymerase elongation subunit (family B)
MSNPQEFVRFSSIYKEKHSSPIFPTILDDLFKMRQEAKAKFKETRDQKYDMKQKATKILMNSFYGVLGHPGFRLYRRDIAEAITWFGRETIQHTKVELEKLNYEVVAGDTDSVFFKGGPHYHVAFQQVNNSSGDSCYE